MATAYEAIPIKGHGITLSLLVWRRFKRPMPGMVERILDSQGHLAKPFLQVGDVVYMPIDPPAEQKKKLNVVSLWD